IYFFFQAEDGIRDFHVTGVQTCALPISSSNVKMEGDVISSTDSGFSDALALLQEEAASTLGENVSLAAEKLPVLELPNKVSDGRSEERRVGKECRCRGGAYV